VAVERYETRWGVVFHRPTCKDDWKNIVSGVSKRKDGSVIPYTAMKLQEPALKSIRAVEKDLSRPWKKFYVRVTGTPRTCEFQAQKYSQDPRRYAPPNAGLHTHGLAIDVHTGFLSEKLRKSLLKHGWHQSRPDDEPWHFSFRLKA
jgi:hypothetical protein